MSSLNLHNQIKEYFEHYPEAVGVYLFGSFARGRQRRNSDKAAQNEYAPCVHE